MLARIIQDNLEILEEVIQDNLDVAELFLRSANGQLIWDLENGRILNSAGFPNPYYEKVLKKGYQTRKKHPFLSKIVSTTYYTISYLTDFSTACKVDAYLESLSKSLQKKHFLE